RGQVHLPAELSAADGLGSLHRTGPHRLQHIEGVVAFTQNLARDYAPFGIRVNAVCPGEIHTPMLDSALARTGRTIDDLHRLVPYGRIGQPAEVAVLVAFLASDEAPFVCGAVVEITGAQAVA